MASEFDFGRFGVSELLEGIAALVLAPVILPVAAGINHPATQEVIKGGLVLSERVKEAAAQTQETLEDLVAEVQAELAEQPKPEISFGKPQTLLPPGRAQIAEDLINVMHDFNEQVRQATEGVADLRLLMSLGLGVLAIRQLLVKGPQLDEIPWYTVAWYAFDSFTKLNAASNFQPKTQEIAIEQT